MRQFTIPTDAPDPAEVDQVSGLVKYDLMDWEHILFDGSDWDGISYAQGILFQPSVQNNGCMLVQLIDGGSLKMELFPGTACNTLTMFSVNFRTYER